jgi:preprotein translocase subunit SecE
MFALASEHLTTNDTIVVIAFMVLCAFFIWIISNR